MPRKTTPPALLPAWPAGTRVIDESDGPAEVTGHLRNTGDGNVVAPCAPDESDQLIVNVLGGSKNVQRAYDPRFAAPLREYCDDATAAAMLATLRGGSFEDAEALRGRGLYDAQDRVRRTPTPAESAVLLRAWYAALPAASPMELARLHQAERSVLAEIAAVLALDAKALRQEMRERFPALATIEASAGDREAAGKARVAAAMAKSKRRKSLPLP